MSNVEQDCLEVAVLGKTVYLKSRGYATQRNSLGIPDFLAAMFRAGCRCVVFDLAECKGMDSTFMGVIADAALARPRQPGKSVVILNADQHATRQLARIGLVPMVCMKQEQVELPEGVELQEMSFVDFANSKRKRLERIRDLHSQLIRLNEGNRALFGPFLEMLAEECRLSRQQ
ncbi:MAG: hypothetical protein J7M08_10625 [Planctomycetes bacterium]|nr:hypothetical protein [Planctomycetota bacterium]